MYKAIVLLLPLIFACDRSAQQGAAGSRQTDTPSLNMTNAQRQATEDSAKAFLSLAHELLERGDSAALMQMYPPTGPLVSAGDGQIMTNRDSVGKSYGELSQVKDAKVTFGDAKIDVLAPGVAAVTMPYQFEGTNQGKKFNNRAVYSAVLAPIAGRMRSIQDHISTMVPKPK
jgi:hypothetical protein